MLRPTSELAQQSRSGLEKESARIEKLLNDTAKLNNAVFYKARKHKNIFHVMHD